VTRWLPELLRVLALELRLALLALQFLTRVPVPTWVGYSEAWLQQSARHFPLVGAIVGAVAALTWHAAALWWPTTIAVLIAMASTLVLTGAFHEDGLADTFDALGGAVSRDKALAIMKDSRLGTYGVAALTCVLAIKAAALMALGAHAAPAMLLAHTASRLTPLLLIRWLPYGGDIESAKAKPLATQLSHVGLAMGLGWVMAVAFALIAARWISINALMTSVAAMLAVALVMRRWLRIRLGGFTGDTLGASQQLSELAIYLSLAAFVVP
jgi:adenosylcobinamide-GDP ribazoletransferase